jgi:hypothetical protein
MTRTLDDLHGAFALLEREADEYAASHDEILVSPADVIPLAAAPSRRRRVRPALWITAAAIAAAVTAGSLVLVSAVGPQRPAAGADVRPDALTPGQLTLPITVPETLDYQVVDAQTNPSFQSVELVNVGSRIDVTLFPRGAQPPNGARGTAVNINGVVGQYVDENRIPHPGQTPVAATASGPDYGTQFGRSVRWRSPVTGAWRSCRPTARRPPHRTFCAWPAAFGSAPQPSFGRPSLCGRRR